jgi:hypothetical protein
VVVENPITIIIITSDITDDFLLEKYGLPQNLKGNLYLSPGIK